VTYHSPEGTSDMWRSSLFDSVFFLFDSLHFCLGPNGRFNKLRITPQPEVQKFWNFSMW